MSFAIDLGEYGPDLKKKYESVISSDPETTWAVFGYDDSGNALKPEESGSGDLDEFVDAFDDAQIQYGIVRVEFNGVNKIVLVGYVGENVSARKRLVFNSHMASVANQFPGHHIQITALSADESTPKIIMDRVNAAAGSKYVGSTKKAPPTKPRYIKTEDGANEDDWGDVKPMEERELTHSRASDYKSSAREESQSFRKGDAPKSKEPIKPREPSVEPEDEEEDAEDKPKGISGLNSGTSYKPVGKIDSKAIRAEAKNSKFADARIEKIEPSYKPVGKVDSKAIREQARKEKQLKAEREAQKSGSKDEPDNEDAPVPARKSFSPVKKESEPESRPSVKSKFTNDSAESQYSTPDRRAEYGVKSHVSKARPAAASSVNGADDDDEPHYSSSADRMKAFQNSVSSAKPKFDASSASKQTPRRPAASSSGSSFQQKSAAGASRDESDEEEDAPSSVAAQLAKSRLSSRSDESSEKNDIQKAREASYGVNSTKKQSAESDEETEETPKASVSTFAARFANKEEPKAADKTPEAPAPAPPRRTPQREPESAPSPSRRAPAAESRAEPEPEEAAEPEGDDNLTAIVIQEYSKDDDDEISSEVDETISQIQKVDENWWIGRNSKGEVGSFPAEYVNVNGESVGNGGNDDEQVEEKIAIALYSHEPNEEDEDELAFAENDKIIVLDFTSDDWWTGRNTKGETGLFPSSYVKLN